MIRIAKFPDGTITYLHDWDSVRNTWNASLVFNYRDDGSIEILKDMTGYPDDDALFIEGDNIIEDKVEIAKFLLKHL